MAPVLTAEDVVRRIAAESAYVDERGAVGIRLEPAAAIVRQSEEQFRRITRGRRRGGTPKNHRDCSDRTFYAFVSGPCPAKQMRLLSFRCSLASLPLVTIAFSARH